MKLNAGQLPGNLQRELAPVYLVAGPEILLREEAVDQIRNAARQQGFTGRERLSAERGFDWGQLNSMGMEMSLFAEKKVVELRLPTGKPGQAGAKAITEALKQSSDDLLLIVAEQWDLSSEKTAWSKKVAAAGVYLPVWTIKTPQLPGWIRQRMQRCDLQPDPDAVQLLAARVDGNLLAAAQEIDKLLLANGPGQVTLADVELAVSDSASFDAFKLCASVLAGQRGLALRITASLRRASIPGQIIVAALVRELTVLQQFRGLIRDMPEQQVFRQLGVWQSRQQVVKTAVRRISAVQLREAVICLAELDRIGKGQQHGEFWIQLERLVLMLTDTATQHRSGPSSNRRRAA